MNTTHFKRIGIFAVTVLLVLGMSWLYFDITGTQQFEREIALLKEQGMLTSLEDLNARLEATEQRESDKKVVAYFFGLKEEKFTKPYSAGTVEIFDTKMITDIDIVWEQWSPEVERVAGLACDENRPLIEETLEIAQSPESNPYTWLDTAKADVFPFYDTPDLRSLIGVTNLLSLQAILCIKKGNPDEALVYVGGTLRLANHISGKGALIELMIANAVRGTALRCMRKIAPEMIFSDKAAKEMERLLLASVRPEDFVHSLGTERFYSILTFTNQKDASNEMSPRAAAMHIVFLNRFIEATQLPFPLAHARLESMQEEMGLLTLWREPISFIMLPSLHRSYISNIQAEARLHQARIALALMRFKQDQGAYPDSLQALAPDYLNTLPEDPFSGSSFRYQKLVQSYVLYSIGENFQDDGPDNESPESVWRMAR